MTTTSGLHRSWPNTLLFALLAPLCLCRAATLMYITTPKTQRLTDAIPRSLVRSNGRVVVGSRLELFECHQPGCKLKPLSMSDVCLCHPSLLLLWLQVIRPGGGGGGR